MIKIIKCNIRGSYTACWRILELKPCFHIVVSDGDVPALTETWRRCIKDVTKSWTGLNFSNLDGDVGDITKQRSHIIVSVPAASPIHWLGRIPVTYDDMETRLWQTIIIRITNAWSSIYVQIITYHLSCSITAGNEKRNNIFHKYVGPQLNWDIFISKQNYYNCICIS